MSTRQEIKSIFIGLVALVSAGWLCGQGLAEEKVGAGYPVLDWQYFGSGGGGAFQFVAAAPTQPNRVYCGIDVGGIYRSDDGGTWQDITGQLPSLCVMTMSEDPLDPHWLYVGTRGGGSFMAYDFLPIRK